MFRFVFILAIAFCGFASDIRAQAASLEQIRPQMRPRPLALALEALRAGDWDTARTEAERDGPVALDIVEWHRLRSGLGTYNEFVAFLNRRSDWPGLDALSRRAEPAVAQQDDALMRSYFEIRAPQSPLGKLAHAGALRRVGETDTADALIVETWRTASMSDTDQAQYLKVHGDLLKPHHTARLDRMLWRRWHSDARQMFALVGDGQVALARARIALHRMTNTVDSLIGKVPKALQDDPGLAHDRFEWRVRKGRWDDAKAMLLAQSASAETLGWPQGWSNRRRSLARDELRDGDAKKAYEMAANHHLTSGSNYADLEWLAGFIALSRLKDPSKALEHFQNHDDAVVTPISKGRAGYWKGRAHLALGDAVAADQEFTRGAAYQTSFYGLLAAEAAGLPFDVGFDAVPTEDWEQSPLIRDSLFQAGVLLVAAGERNLAERFWTHLARQLGEHDAALLGQAAIDLGEPHLAVMIGKAIARRGFIAPVAYYALHPLTRADLPVPTELALAIARRESEFDPVVVSGAGARGLMQLMPATAQQVARQLDLAEVHSTERLTRDPLYNAQLGTVYLKDLIARFGGNIIMVAAAYNAGPARPVGWMERFGDPRGKSVEEMIDWIELIPFRETRNYVMRVSESLPIYRARLGGVALPVPFGQELVLRNR